jgi:hypothetical protein
VTAAARQYVRKLSGYRTPSQANRAVFEQAIEEIAAATERMLAALGSEPVEGPERPPVRTQPDGATGSPPRRRTA